VVEEVRNYYFLYCTMTLLSSDNIPENRTKMYWKKFEEQFAQTIELW